MIDAGQLTAWLERRAGALGDAADEAEAAWMPGDGEYFRTLRARRLELLCIIGRVQFETERPPHLPHTTKLINDAAGWIE